LVKRSLQEEGSLKDFEMLFNDDVEVAVLSLELLMKSNAQAFLGMQGNRVVILGFLVIEFCRLTI